MKGRDAVMKACGEIPPELAEDTGRLLAASFGMRGGISAMPKVDLHCFALDSGSLAAYCGFIERMFTIGGTERPLLFLGLVCVHPDMRRKGMGLFLLKGAVAAAEKFADDPEASRPGPSPRGIILNCGRALVPFYEASGFREISPRAIYLRDGNRETDEDPVMALAFGKDGFPARIPEGVFMGIDF